MLFFAILFLHCPLFLLQQWIDLIGWEEYFLNDLFFVEWDFINVMLKQLQLLLLMYLCLNC